MCARADCWVNDASRCCEQLQGGENMITTVIRHRCSDGTEWVAVGPAQHREDLIAEVAEAMSLIPNPKVGTKQYYQHDKQKLWECRRKIFELAKREHLQSWPEMMPLSGDTIHPMSGVSRILSDCEGPVAKAWNRFGSIDFDNARQFDQCYRVSHQDEATECMNPEFGTNQCPPKH